MKRIKLLFYTELWANAGIESVIMSLFRYFDLTRIQVDIMASQDISDFYDNEIESLGGRKIITLKGKYNLPAKRMLANRRAFKDAILKNGYDVVHIHMCNAAAMSYGKIAKQCGVKCVVYHSHNTNLSSSHRHIKTAVHFLAKYRYEKYGDMLFSCSDLASKWMFTRKSLAIGKILILNNAIDLERFAFSEKGRKDERKRLGIDNEVVIGHIGRFQETKNQSFLLDVFKKYVDVNPDAKLVLVGEGEDNPKLREKAAKLGILNKVVFYGTTHDIPLVLWAMDVFVLPSLYEGNPVVGIEAQAASVPCIFADTITKMCNISSTVKYLSLGESLDTWVKAIQSAVSYSRHSNTEQMRRAGYDIKSVALELQDMYEEWFNKKGKVGANL